MFPILFLLMKKLKNDCNIILSDKTGKYFIRLFQLYKIYTEIRIK